MLLLVDKIFVGLAFVLVSPVLFFCAFVLVDITLSVLFCAYAFFSIQLVSSDCFLTKSIGYGVLSAPILLFLHVHDDTLGGKVPTLEL